MLLFSGAGADAGEVQGQGVEEGVRGGQAGAHEAGTAPRAQGVLQIGQFLSRPKLENLCLVSSVFCPVKFLFFADLI